MGSPRSATQVNGAITTREEGPMRCPSCGLENPLGMKLCGQCATPFTGLCPQCSVANALRFAFCWQCATPLSAAPSLATPSPQIYTPAHLAEKILTSKTALEGERKQDTVLVADLKGSMALLADRDPEEARAILHPVVERMMVASHRDESMVNAEGQVQINDSDDTRSVRAKVTGQVLRLDDALQDTIPALAQVEAG
jgi:double zinc ribbon protein